MVGRLKSKEGLFIFICKALYVSVLRKHQLCTFDTLCITTSFLSSSCHRSFMFHRIGVYNRFPDIAFMIVRCRRNPPSRTFVEAPGLRAIPNEEKKVGSVGDDFGNQLFPSFWYFG